MLNNFKYDFKKVDIPELIDKLQKQSALTFEGMLVDQDNLKDILDWLNEHNALIPNQVPIFYEISGELMNSTFGLTGTN